MSEINEKNNITLQSITKEDIIKYRDILKLYEKVHNKIDEEKTNDEFGKEIVENVIIKFIESEYKLVKIKIDKIDECDKIETFESEDLLSIILSLKTTSKFFFYDDFSDICQKLEIAIKKYDYIGIKQVKPVFLKYLDIFYLDILLLYFELKGSCNSNIINDFNSLISLYDLNKEHNKDRRIDKIDLKSFDTKIDKTGSIDEYGDDMFIDCIIDYIEIKYNLMLFEVNTGFETKNEKMIKNVIHKVKTTAKFILGMKFAECCQLMENLSSKNLDWVKLHEKREYFFNYTNAFYIELFRYYIELKLSLNNDVSINYDTYYELLSKFDVNIDEENNNYNEINCEKGIELLTAIDNSNEKAVDDLLVSLIEKEYNIVADAIEINDKIKLIESIVKLNIIVKKLFIIDYERKFDLLITVILKDDESNFKLHQEKFIIIFNKFYTDLLPYYKTAKANLNQELHPNYNLILFKKSKKNMRLLLSKFVLIRFHRGINNS